MGLLTELSYYHTSGSKLNLLVVNKGQDSCTVRQFQMPCYQDWRLLALIFNTNEYIFIFAKYAASWIYLLTFICFVVVIKRDVYFSKGTARTTTCCSIFTINSAFPKDTHFVYIYSFLRCWPNEVHTFSMSRIILKYLEVMKDVGLGLFSSLFQKPVYFTIHHHHPFMCHVLNTSLSVASLFLKMYLFIYLCKM